MPEYIDREAAYEKCGWYNTVNGKSVCAVRKDELAAIPAADVAPVVRCRDCKHWKKGDFMGGDTPDSLEYGGGCPLVRFARYESDFCSKGEREDGDGNG